MRKLITAMAILFVMAFALHNTSYGAGLQDGAVVDPFHAYSYEDMLRDAAALRDRYPGLIRLGSIGKSVEGRELLLLELGSGSRKIFVDGAMHANEYITASYLMYMAEQYASAYQLSGTLNGFDLREILSKTTLCIVPMVNPDGVNLVQNGPSSALEPEAVSAIAKNDRHFTSYARWKANINGIDLNRNFNNNWAVVRPVTSPAARLFKGYSPVSEPETQAVESYVKNNVFWAFINFHSQGEGLYGWDDKNIAHYPELKQMVSRILSDSGFKKLTDTSETNYGTFAGYARETFLKPTLTLELCRYSGSATYPDSDFLSVWNPAQNICLIIAEEVLAMRPQEYLVFSDGLCLQAFYDNATAHEFAALYADAAVIYVKGGIEAVKSCVRAASAVSLDGKDITLQAYAIDGSSYFKLRDLAMVLNGTSKQFTVGYDVSSKAITLTPGQPYTPVGGELQVSGVTVASVATAASAFPTHSTVYLNGQAVSLTVYTIGSNNYFRLRDVGKALDFGVTWDGTANMIRINTTVGYIE